MKTTTEMELEEFEQDVMNVLTHGCMSMKEISENLAWNQGRRREPRWLPATLNKLRREGRIQKRRGAYSLLENDRKAAA